MLSIREFAWWPLAPLLLAQGLYVRCATPRLLAAAGERGAVGSGPRRLRLVGVGDSIIAGIGVRHQVQGLVGQLAARLAERHDATVEWLALGRSGATAAVIGERVLGEACAAAPAVVLVSLGVNDAVSGTAPAAFRRRLRDIVDFLASRTQAQVVFAGIPPLASFPALPRPLATLLGRRAAALAEAAATLSGHRGFRHVQFPASLANESFASDGFHPGPQACADWSHHLADSLARDPAASAPGEP